MGHAKAKITPFCWSAFVGMCLFLLLFSPGGDAACRGDGGGRSLPRTTPFACLLLAVLVGHVKAKIAPFCWSTFVDVLVLVALFARVYCCVSWGRWRQIAVKRQE